MNPIKMTLKQINICLLFGREGDASPDEIGAINYMTSIPLDTWLEHVRLLRSLHDARFNFSSKTITLKSHCFTQ